MSFNENPYILFYGQHNISPVHQDLSNFNIHLKRRGTLYRLLGLPPVFFHNRLVLEVGPGGGYNSLALFMWGAKVDFVEPNPTAQNEVKNLLRTYKVPDDHWRLFPLMVEEFETNLLYDLVIAEGFLAGLFERSKVIDKLRSLVQPGGVIIVTCGDVLSLFFETLKRAVAFRLIRQVSVFEEKVRLLSNAFDSHLKALKYSSRSIEDWVIDTFLNPATFGKLFSIKECLVEFGDEFIFLSSSPLIFTNLQWYKDYTFDIQKNIIEQYQMKQHVFLWWDLPESIRPASENERLEVLASDIRRLGMELEETGSLEPSVINQMVPLLTQFKNISLNIDARIGKAIDEAIHLLTDEDLTPEKVANCNHFAQAFGRGQQYVSLQKKVVL